MQGLSAVEQIGEMEVAETLVDGNGCPAIDPTAE